MDLDLEAIQQLIIEQIAGTITPEEEAYLQETIATHPAAKALWQDMHQVLHPGKVDELRANLRMDKADAILHTSRERKLIFYYVRAVSIAAVLVLAAVVSWKVFFTTRTGAADAPLTNHQHIALQLANGKTIDLSTAGQQVQLDNMTLNNANKKLSYTATTAAPQLITLRIPAGKDYTIILSDGTEIMLNSASTLQFPSAFTGNTREVTIQGEAFLKVALQAGKPFLVHLPGNTVQVLGTSFNVNTYDSAQVKIALVSGKVKVRTAKDSTVLKPGFEAVSGLQGVQTAPFDEEEVLSWQKGVYDFYNVPFSEAAKVISRWYGIDFVIDNPALNNRLFSGAINRNKPIQVFLQNMKATNGLNYEIKDETIHIK
ncbi:FecR family protein [Chitinophaga agrisoli]|uniref:FecR family protein n=1 Tax=Chitinophaga agrisoli TaxID=2607653 RepID=A0A5B2VNM1_9BACT|nr:FecR family protein [Chitinophaga agrisoli]KAA2239739.1 FecR family protein [Chitinophaga agrisoli]